jgi:exodeoxyribonuclease V alpha subunit
MKTLLELDASQSAAVSLAESSRFACVTGGPGTGKTTCMEHLVARLRARGLTVSLAAPTGKAAIRLSAKTGETATTVHRLLGYSPNSNSDWSFAHGEDNPIEADCVIVDEASMLDIELAAALMRAIPPSTSLVLVGDANQLPSVGAGRVFADFVESGAVPVARLTTVHRSASESWINTQAPVILRGEVPDLKTWPGRFEWVRTDSKYDVVAACVNFAGAAKKADASFQILSPVHKYEAGVDALNLAVQDACGSTRRIFKIGDDSIVGLGDRVLQTRNDYELEIMNGELGEVIHADAKDDSLVVEFEDGKCKEIGASARFGLRLGNALTIHKSQGSEWDEVVVVVHSTHSKMLTRQLLYTAVTRAKKKVVIVGDEKGIKHAVRNPESERRNTRLALRLRGEYERKEAA